ncbi:MAG: nuclear transport factor 2 family protein [Verrucomicrobiaceae bacterium]|nr:MAG: nuclear transport factor 2 family protein [Verrucomicrobiaceae bacterium]
MKLKTFSLAFALCLPLAASEEDKEALRKLRGIYEQAIAARDFSPLQPHLAADFTGVMITADEVKGYDGILAYWKQVEDYLGKDGTYKVTIEPDETTFEGNLAIAKGRALEQVTRKGSAFDFTTQWTAIARKEGNAWKLVRIQASIDPVNNPIVASLQKMKLWITGGVAALVGLIIGRLLPRRKAQA